MNPSTGRGGGNPKIDKSRSKARIDPISALVIACGLYEARKDKPGIVWATRPDDPPGILPPGHLRRV